MSTLDKAPGARAGSVIAGRFVLEEKLGEGGMGAVFRAEQRPLGRKVALKLIGAASDATTRARFLREALSVSAVQHPSVVTLYDFGDDDEHGPFLAMELVEGRSLAAVLAAEGRLPWRRALALAKEAAAGLAAAHAKDVVHLDVKPANLLLDDTGRLKVVDFGLAHAVRPDVAPQLTQSGVVVGTPRYLSPEQIRGVRDEPRSDLYALGAVLFELLTSRPVFEEQNAAMLLVSHLGKPPPRPSAAGAQALPEALDALVVRLLAKDPEERPKSALALLALLEAIEAEADGGAGAGDEAGATLSDDDALRPPPAPTGHVTLVCCLIPDAAALWERAPTLMRSAQELGMELVGELARSLGGYPANCLSDRTLYAFAREEAAVRFALTAQEKLLRAPWPAALLEEPEAREEKAERGEGALLFRGIRVGMGIASGEVESRTHPRTGSVDYFGAPVRQAARLGNAARGGQVLLTPALVESAAPFLDVLGAELRPLSGRISESSEAVMAVEVIAPSLSGRRFDAAERRSKRRRTNLSPSSSSFVGRERALEELEEAFAEGGRLVTLLGPGGTGKTRLSQRYAQRVLEEEAPEGGVWFCDLTAARTLPQVAGALAEALGISLLGGETDTQQVEVVGAALQQAGPAFMVLDNFEQVVELAPATVGRWLDAASSVRLLVTSREALALDGERRLELPPLDEDEAVALFGERAAERGRRPSAEEEPVVRDIVRTLDGMPLAIELAAARSQLLSPAQIKERLGRRFDLLRGGSRGRSDRQATLRGAIDWSWELLDEHERLAFAQCSVFAGGFSIEAAEAVVVAGTDAPFSLDLLQALRDKSLLRTRPSARRGAPPRFDMYESLRAYAAERLQEAGDEEEGQRRHARFFSALGEELADACHGPQVGDALARLAEERDNLLVAWERDAEPAAAQRCALSLAPLLEARGPPSLLRRLLEDVAERGEERLALRARLLHGSLEAMWGSASVSLPLLERVVAEAEALGERELLAEGLRMLARSKGRHDGQGGEPELARALSIALEDGLTRLEARIENDRGVVGSLLGFDAEESAALAARSLELACALGDRQLEGRIRGNLAILYTLRGELELAVDEAERALAIHRELDDRRMMGVVLGNLGQFYLGSGDVERASSLLEQAVELHREVGAHGTEAADATALVSCRLLTGRLQEARSVLARAKQACEETGSVRERAVVSCVDSALHAIEGDPEAAEEALARAAKLFGERFWYYRLLLTPLEGMISVSRARGAQGAARDAALARARASLDEAHESPTLVLAGWAVRLLEQELAAADGA